MLSCVAEYAAALEFPVSKTRICASTHVPLALSDLGPFAIHLPSGCRLLGIRKRDVRHSRREVSRAPTLWSVPRGPIGTVPPSKSPVFVVFLFCFVFTKSLPSPMSAFTSQVGKFP